MTECYFNTLIIMLIYILRIYSSEHNNIPKIHVGSRLANDICWAPLPQYHRSFLANDATSLRNELDIFIGFLASIRSKLRDLYRLI